MKVDHEKSIMLHKSPAESPRGHADGNFRPEQFWAVYRAG
jgi:hypothetical protein